KKNKWDISKPSRDEVLALIDYVGPTPVVTGFIYPQISQMTHDDPRLRYNRHSSDVQSYTDGQGNMGILHPSGAHITLGAVPDPKDFSGANFDKNLTIDRNTGQKVFMRVALAGNVAVLTMTPQGECTLKLESNLSVECQEATITARDRVTVDSPETYFTGKVEIDGEVQTHSTITADGDMIAGPDKISAVGHKHKGDSGGETDVPH
ncbi:hypothetical protein ACVOZ6_004677, partial [Escherichia coli]